MGPQGHCPAKPADPLAILTGVVLVLFCGFGIATILDYIPAEIVGGSAIQARPRVIAVGLAKPHAAPAHAAGTAPAGTYCGSCGVIEAVREIKKPRPTTGAAMVAGAASGAVLGYQVSGGSGRDLMAVLGLLLGALSGNQMQKEANSTKTYEITVRFDDGSTRVLTELNPPAWKAGDPVKIINGRIRPHT